VRTNEEIITERPAIRSDSWQRKADFATPRAAAAAEGCFSRLNLIDSLPPSAGSPGRSSAIS
jgi:hypothetical protein